MAGISERMMEIHCNKRDVFCCHRDFLLSYQALPGFVSLDPLSKVSLPKPCFLYHWMAMQSC